MPTVEIVETSKEQALAAVREQAFTTEGEYEYQPTGEHDANGRPLYTQTTVVEPRRLAHCKMSFLGADWDVESVEEVIRDATRVAWVIGDPFGHELGVESGGKAYRFDVTRPAEGTGR